MRCTLFAAIPAVVALALGACASNRPARINHVVFMTLKDPAHADALVEACDAELASIPGVTSYFAGKHLDTGRPTVDADYDVGLYLGFDTEEAYSGYVEHPAHVAFVEAWLPQLELLLVRDVLDETP
jgi:hypothetical protein